MFFQDFTCCPTATHSKILGRAIDKVTLHVAVLRRILRTLLQNVAPPEAAKGAGLPVQVKGKGGAGGSVL